VDTAANCISPEMLEARMRQRHIRFRTKSPSDSDAYLQINQEGNDFSMSYPLQGSCIEAFMLEQVTNVQRSAESSGWRAAQFRRGLLAYLQHRRFETEPDLPGNVTSRGEVAPPIYIELDSPAKVFSNRSGACGTAVGAKLLTQPSCQVITKAITADGVRDGGVESIRDKGCYGVQRDSL
jgi:hypothetical protein